MNLASMYKVQGKYYFWSSKKGRLGTSTIGWGQDYWLLLGLLAGARTVTISRWPL